MNIMNNQIMNTTEKLQFNLMKIIFNEGDVKVLEKISKFVNKAIATKETVKDAPAFMQAVKPIRRNVTLAQIKKEQNYKRVTFEEFRAIADKIEWEESLEELLDAIK